MSRKVQHRPRRRSRHGIEPGEKPKEFKKTLRRLLTYLKPHKVVLTFVIFASIFATVFNVISPKLLGDATSSIFASVMSGTAVDFPFLKKLLLNLFGLYVLSSLFAYLQQYLMAGIAQKTSAQLRKKVNEKLARLPLSYYDKQSYGDILSRVINDIDNINHSIQQALSQMIRSVIMIIGTIVMMIFISPILTLVVFITFPLSGLVIRIVTSFSQKHFIRQQNELGRLNGHIEEVFSGHQVVKAFGHEKTAINKFVEINTRLYDSGWRAQFISGIMMPLMTFVGNLGYVFVSIGGGLLVLNGHIRIGDVQAFIQYSQQLSQPMSQAAGIANMIQTALASAERVFALLDEDEERKEKQTPIDFERLEGKVTFDQVNFSYEKGKRVIHQLSLDVEPGQMVAIVGPTGAGKTTIINLLMKFYELDSGKIVIDGMNIAELSREQVRSMFGMVLQDTWLFSGTIRENIAYGKKDASEEDVIAAAKSAYADDFIRTLPDGYETVLSEDASNISQGQRQLITIARAILADPKMLILDEATSSVDTRTEMHIQQAMGELMKGRTSFVIAHRLSTIRDADVILVMKKGEVVEKGAHNELMKQNGFYAELYESQFSEGNM